jgi:PPOX class probable F420-dependent enzyme
LYDISVFVERGGIVNLAERGAGFAEFWRERHLCTFTTVRPDGTPHVVPVGATLDLETGVARVITSRDSHKARLIAAGPRPVALCQVDGRRWSTLEGVATLRADPAEIADAEARYAARYKPPRANPRRVVLEIEITNVLGSV